MLISNASKIVDDILSQNKLIPETGSDDFFSIPKNHLKRFYATACKTEEDEKVFLKILINDNPEDQKTITNEIKLYQYLSNQDFRHFRAPHIFTSGQKPVIWYKREFIESGTIADMHFILEGFLPEIDKYSSKAVNALSEMVDFIPPKNSEIFSEPKNYFLKRIEEYDQYVSKYIPNFKKTATEKYGATLENVDDDKILVHGDFHLENLFFEDNGLVIADWERVHTGNVAEDFSSLWVSLWQVPEIQAKSLSDFYKQLSGDQKKSFNKNISAMLFLQSAKEFQHWIFCKDVHRNPRYTIKTVDEGFNYFQNLLKGLLDGSFKINEVI